MNVPPPSTTAGVHRPPSLGPVGDPRTRAAVADRVVSDLTAEGYTRHQIEEVLAAALLGVARSDDAARYAVSVEYHRVHGWRSGCAIAEVSADADDAMARVQVLRGTRRAVARTKLTQEAATEAAIRDHFARADA